MRSSVLVVLLSVDIVGFGKLWLDGLLPLCLPNCLCLLDAWGSIFGAVDFGRSDDMLVDDIVVGLCGIDVWRSVFVVVGRDVWEDCGLELEVGPADLRRGFEIGRASCRERVF